MNINNKNKPFFSSQFFFVLASYSSSPSFRDIVHIERQKKINLFVWHQANSSSFPLGHLHGNKNVGVVKRQKNNHKHIKNNFIKIKMTRVQKMKLKINVEFLLEYFLKFKF